MPVTVTAMRLIVAIAPAFDLLHALPILRTVPVTPFSSSSWFTAFELLAAVLQRVVPHYGSCLLPAFLMPTHLGCRACRTWRFS